MSGHSVHSVLYDDGTDADIFALVIKKNEDGTLNLFAIRESGEPEVANGIPEGEGGRTWHK